LIIQLDKLEDNANLNNYMKKPKNKPQVFSMEAALLENLPTLRFGDSGNAVRVLQRLLSSNGYPVRIDGNFGALTETAVKAFQSQQNLVADGVVGPKTWQKLTK
jgi:peptidoglycan hydrolase-like protein with peptidoglycan-binding domain